MKLQVSELAGLKVGEVVCARKIFDGPAEAWGIVVDDGQDDRGVFFFQHSEEYNAHAVMEYPVKVLATGKFLRIIGDPTRITFVRNPPNPDNRTDQKLIVIGSEVAFLVSSRRAPDRVGITNNVFIRLDGTIFTFDDVGHRELRDIVPLENWRWTFGDSPGITLEMPGIED